MNRKISIIVVTAISLGLAACGTATGPAGAGTPAASESGSASEPDNVEEGTPEENAMAEGLISMYLEDGKMSVGIDEEHLPLMTLNNGVPEGAGAELVKETASRLNVETEFINLKGEELLGALGDSADVSFVNAAAAAEKADTVGVSDPVYEVTYAVLLPADTDIQGRDDMFGKIIGCRPGTEAELFVGDLGAEDGTTEKREYANAADGVEELLSGDLDALILESAEAQKYLDENQDALTMLEGSAVEIESESYVFVMPKIDTILLEQLNNAISEMKADGTIDRLAGAQ